MRGDDIAVTTETPKLRMPEGLDVDWSAGYEAQGKPTAPYRKERITGVDRHAARERDPAVLEAAAAECASLQELLEQSAARSQGRRTDAEASGAPAAPDEDRRVPRG